MHFFAECLVPDIVHLSVVEQLRLLIVRQQVLEPFQRVPHTQREFSCLDLLSLLLLLESSFILLPLLFKASVLLLLSLLPLECLV